MSKSRIRQGLVAIVGTGICSWHSGELFEGWKLSRALVCQGAKVESHRCIPVIQARHGGDRGTGLADEEGLRLRWWAERNESSYRVDGKQ